MATTKKRAAKKAPAKRPKSKRAATTDAGEISPALARKNQRALDGLAAMHSALAQSGIPVAAPGVTDTRVQMDGVRMVPV